MKSHKDCRLGQDQEHIRRCTAYRLHEWVAEEMGYFRDGASTTNSAR